MIGKIDSLIEYARDEKLKSKNKLDKKYWVGYIQGLFDMKELVNN